MNTMTRPPERPDLARRGLLRGLASLPLVGGSVAILGRPTAAAEPLNEALLESYDAWLFFERRLLQRELGRPRRSLGLGIGSYRDATQVEWHDQFDVVPMANAGGNYHWPGETPEPSTRAAIVLSAVGCDWRRQA